MMTEWCEGYVGEVWVCRKITPGKGGCLRWRTEKVSAAGAQTQELTMGEAGKQLGSKPPTASQALDRGFGLYPKNSGKAIEEF